MYNFHYFAAPWKGAHVLRESGAINAQAGGPAAGLEFPTFPVSRYRYLFGFRNIVIFMCLSVHSALATRRHRAEVEGLRNGGRRAGTRPSEGLPPRQAAIQSVNARGCSSRSRRSCGAGCEPW